MKNKGFTLIEMLVASTLVMLIVLGFSAMTIGFNSQVDSDFNGMQKSYSFIGDRMLAQELLSDKITAVKQEYNNPIFWEDSNADRDKAVLAEQTVQFQSANGNSNITFNVEYVDKEKAVTAPNNSKFLIEDINLNLDQVDVKYRPIKISSKKDSNEKFDIPLLYAVGDTGLEVFDLPQIETITSNIYKKPLSLKANKTNLYLPAYDRKIDESIIFGESMGQNNNQNSVISNENASFTITAKIKNKLNLKKVHYNWYIAKDNTYNIPYGNYYNGDEDDEYASATGSAENNESADTSALLLKKYSPNFINNDYEVLKEEQLGMNSVTLPEDKRQDLFEFIGGNIVVEAVPESKQFGLGNKVIAPPFYIGPKYLDKTNLKYAINASWIDVTKDNLNGEVNRESGKRIVKQIHNHANSAGTNEKVTITGKPILHQPDKDELYMRSRYATFGADSEMKFALDPNKKYQVFAVVRNNTGTADETVLPAIGIPGTGGSGGGGGGGTPPPPPPPEYDYLPLGVYDVNDWAMKGASRIVTWHFNLNGNDMRYYEPSDFTHAWSVYSPDFVDSRYYPRLDEISQRLGNHRFESKNGSVVGNYEIVEYPENSNKYCVKIEKQTNTGDEDSEEDSEIVKDGDYYYAPLKICNENNKKTYRNNEKVVSWYFRVNSMNMFFLDNDYFNLQSNWWRPKTSKFSGINTSSPVMADLDKILTTSSSEVLSNGRTITKVSPNLVFRFSSPWNNGFNENGYQIVKTIKTGEGAVYYVRWHERPQKAYRIEVEWKEMTPNSFNGALVGQDATLAQSKLNPPAYTFYAKDRRFFDFPPAIENEIKNAENAYQIYAEPWNDTNFYNFTNAANNIINANHNAGKLFFPSSEWSYINSTSNPIYYAPWIQWEFWSRDIAESSPQPPKELFEKARYINFRGVGHTAYKDRFYKSTGDSKNHRFEFKGRFEKIDGKYYFNWDWKTPSAGAEEGVEYRKPIVYKINVEPQDSVLDANSHYWQLEYQEVENMSELKLGAKDCDIAEVLIFEEGLDENYQKQLMESLRTKYAPLNDLLNVTSNPSTYEETYKKDALYTLPMAITDVQFNSGKYGMAAIEFDNPTAAAALNTTNTGTFTANAHLKGYPNKKVTYTLKVVD